MGFLISFSLGAAEEFLRRHVKSKAVREAEKRRQQRRARELLNRVKRGAAVAGTSGVAVAGYGLAVAPVGTAGFVAAGAAAATATAAALFWPATRREPAPGGIIRCELEQLAAEAENWLLERRLALPGSAGPALDAILVALRDLEPHLCRLDGSDPLAGDAGRLIGEHLPRLVESFLALPSQERKLRATTDRLIASLQTVADELVRLCREAGRDRLLNFDTQERFIHSRYRERGW
jgi:hypothetical protein